MANGNGKRKYESIGAAFGVAAKAAVPIVVGGLGAAAGAVGLRWLAAKYMPTEYMTKRWLPPVLGVGGAFVGATVASLPLISLRTKSGREKAFKATLPLVAVGGTAVAVIATLGPMFWHRFRTAYPNVAMALVPPPRIALTNGGTTGATGELSEYTAREPEILPAPTGGFTVSSLADAYALKSRSGGLSPSQWASIESRRSGGLRQSTTSRRRAGGTVTGINRPSQRWAG
jgi:hypothetical protein